MKKVITKTELWNLPTEQIAEMTRGKVVRIVLNNGEKTDVQIKNLLGASNSPHLFSGFITSENHTIYLQVIDYVELI